jgi:hypothetical protein
MDEDALQGVRREDTDGVTTLHYVHGEHALLKVLWPDVLEIGVAESVLRQREAARGRSQGRAARHRTPAGIQREERRASELSQRANRQALSQPFDVSEARLAG